MAARLTAFLVVAIVAVTVIAGLIVGAQRDDETGPVDLIVYNGRVFTADGRGTQAEAVAVRGNRILQVGTNRAIKRLRRPQTTVIDAHGGAVLPGFNDAHAHVLSGGLSLETLNLLDATTLAGIEGRIRDFAAANPERPWVTGRGWYYQPFPGGLPTRHQLDAIVPDRPAFLRAYDGHTAWVNSKALALAGITRATEDPKDGVVVRDPATGEPTGVLKEGAMSLVSTLVPEPTREERLDALRAATDEAHRLGITSVQNAGGSAEDLELLDELRETGELDVRVYAALSVTAPPSAAEAEQLDTLWKRFPDDPLFKTGAVKLMADGVIESHTAAMLAPYANRPGTTGAARFTAEDLTRTVETLDRRGWQVMVHAIGDGAVRMALDAFEHAAAVGAAPARGRRHRVEHVESVDPEDLPRFGALGVIASMQPFHANPSPNQIDVWAANIGPERASRGWAYGTIREHGGRVVFGSDWPVVTLDPRFGLNMAVNRTTPEGTPEGGWYPAERLTLDAAIEAYTSDAAYASFDEHRKGTLAPGMLADIVVLSADVFDAPPSRLLDARVDVTIFDGKVVFQRDGDDRPATE